MFRFGVFVTGLAHSLLTGYGGESFNGVRGTAWHDWHGPYASMGPTQVEEMVSESGRKYIDHL